MLKQKRFLGFILAMSGLFTASSFSGENAVPMITERHHPEAFVQEIQNDPQAGKKIYEQFCSVCHAKDPGIHVGAPRIGVKNDWAPRIKNGLEGLLTVSIAGLNQMPPRGGCFECSDAQLKAAIVYMLPPSYKKIK